jgi:hypothetical protein
VYLEIVITRQRMQQADDDRFDAAIDPVLL